MGVDIIMGHITITNSGGSLEFEALSWSGSWSCIVAKRKVPMRVEGEKVDSGTYILKAKNLKFSLRLTDDSYSTLKDIYDSKTIVTIVATQDDDNNVWTYVGWFSNFPLGYESSHNGEEEREWISELEFIIESVTYG
jgi:hypothetical protein